jgi:hypothetical protein
VSELTLNQVRLLESWRGLADTTPGDEDDISEELAEWKARAATLIDWLLRDKTSKRNEAYR